MPIAASPKPAWKPILSCGQAGQQRSEERADVDAHVEDREACVATIVVLVVQATDHRGGVRLEPAAAECDQHQTDADAPQAGEDRERDVPAHDHDGAVEQGAFGADQPVRDPRADDRREVDRAAVCADDARGGRPRQCRGHRRRRVVQVIDQDALHAVEGEPLPHLDAEQVRQTPRLAEEACVLIPLDGRVMAGGLAHQSTVALPTAYRAENQPPAQKETARTSSVAAPTTFTCAASGLIPVTSRPDRARSAARVPRVQVPRRIRGSRADDGGTSPGTRASPRWRRR